MMLSRSVGLALAFFCSTFPGLLFAEAQSRRPFQHRFSGGPLDFSLEGCAQILPDDLRGSLPRIQEASTDLRYEELWNPDVYSDINVSGGFAYETDSWHRLAIVHVFRWYANHPGFTSMPNKSDLRAAYVTLDADGFGESFYYYAGGLPVLAVQRRTTFHVSHFDDTFDPRKKSISENWLVFRNGALVSQCRQQGEVNDSTGLSEQELAQVYADALFYKTLRACEGRD